MVVSRDRLLKKFYEKKSTVVSQDLTWLSNESKVEIGLGRDRGAEGKHADRSWFYKDIIAYNAFWEVFM